MDLIDDIDLKKTLEEAKYILRMMEEVELTNSIDSESTFFNEFSRKKRQTAPVNCTDLRSQLSALQAQINTLTSQIANTTATLDKLNIQTADMRKKLNVPLTNTTTNQKLYDILLRYINTTTGALNTLNKQLSDLNTSAAKIRSDIQIYCDRAPVTNPCGK